MPGSACGPGTGGRQLTHEFFIAQGCHIKGRPALLGLMTNAPDATVGLVPIGMIARYLVVGDDRVVPIHHIQTTIRTKVNRYGAEVFVPRGNELTRQLKPHLTWIDRRAAGTNALDLAQDRIGNQKGPVPGTWKTAQIFAQGKARKPCAPHLKIRQGRAPGGMGP